MKSTILIIEDDKDINEMLTSLLTNNGFNVENAYSGTEGLLVHSDNVDLILLDLMLPGKNGEEIIKELKEKNNVPVIVMSAIEDVNKKIDLFSLGANDYVTKPFRPLELIARVKAQLRRYKKYSTIPSEQEHTEILTYKKLALNTKNYECSLDGEPLSLTPTEFAILRILLEKQGMVISLEDLFHTVWKDEYYSKNSSTITVHIRHLREKLKDTAEKPQYIKTIWGVGYKI